MRISIYIPDEKWEEYKRCFLRSYPNNTSFGETPITDDDWIRLKIFQFARRAYRRGKQRLHRDQNKPIYDKDIVV